MENKSNNIRKQAKELCLLLSLGALTGIVSITAMTDIFHLENVFSLAFSLMAGPGSIITALSLDGTLKQRAFVALITGIVATTLVILAAVLGSVLLSRLNLTIIKLAGGIAVLLIGLMIMGLNLPEKLPIIIVISGIIGGLIFN